MGVCTDTARGLLIPSLRPRLIPITSTIPTTVDTTDMARGLLMPSLRPRLIPITSMATDSQLMDTTDMARGLLMPNLRLRLIPTTSPIPTTDTAMVFMARGLLMPSLSPMSSTVTTDTHMATESNQREPKFAHVHY